MYSWWDLLGCVAARDGVWVLRLWGVELDLLPGVWHLNARGNLFSLNLVYVSPLIFPREISEKKNHDNKFLKGRWVSHFPEQGRKNWLLFLGCERDPSGKFDIISFDYVLRFIIFAKFQLIVILYDAVFVRQVERFEIVSFFLSDCSVNLLLKQTWFFHFFVVCKFL